MIKYILHVYIYTYILYVYISEIDGNNKTTCK